MDKVGKNHAPERHENRLPGIVTMLQNKYLPQLRVKSCKAVGPSGMELWEKEEENNLRHAVKKRSTNSQVDKGLLETAESRISLRLNLTKHLEQASFLLMPLLWRAYAKLIYGKVIRFRNKMVVG